MVAKASLSSPKEWGAAPDLKPSAALGSRADYDSFAATLFKILGPDRAADTIDRIIARGCDIINGETWCIDYDTMEFYLEQ